MNPSQCVLCPSFPCTDVDHGAFAVPDLAIDPERVSLVLISEAAPANRADYYYALGEPLFAQTTVQAFCDAGAAVDTLQDVLSLGVYLTTAVKCAKTGYGIETATVKECSKLLEQELALFPHTKAYLLMGDVAIKAFNELARRQGAGRVIPAGATYKLRGGHYAYQDRPVFPSYLQAGPAFFIEKSKRRMIAEDIASALACIAP